MSTTQQPSREREDGDAEEAPRERTSLFDSNMNETQRRSRFLSLLSLLCLVAIVLVLVSPAAEEEEYSTSHFKDSVANQIDSLGSTLTHYAGYRTVHRTAQPVDYRTVDEGDLTTDALQFNGAALSSWSESTLYVQRTDALYQSRPSSFGPHLTEQDMTGLLFPITAFAKNSDSYACSPVPTTPSPSPLIVQRSVIASNRTVPANWIALVQRGHCAFSDKVRFAQYHGASAVLFGDQAYEEGGIGGFGGLLTPWSPDETPDIHIPSAFVSRASYLSILKTYADEQRLSTPATNTDEQAVSHEQERSRKDPVATTPRGLVVVLSREEEFAWPLLDMLLLLLFLPTLLTLLTFFTHRVRELRRQKAERAPRKAVAKLPVFVWGATEEKLVQAAAVVDEERDLGGDGDGTEPTESTALLPSPTYSRFSRFIAPATRLVRRVNPFAITVSSDLAPRTKAHHFSPNVECSICLSDFEKGDRVMELPCGHLFHENEIMDWLLGSSRLCPICRASLTVDDSKPSQTDSSPAAATLAAHLAPADLITLTPSSPATAPISLPASSVPTHLAGSLPVASSSSVTLDSQQGIHLPTRNNANPKSSTTTE